MISRLAILLTVALSIVWQSGCLEIEDGMLVNRCGLWQRLTGKPMIVSLGDIPKPVVTFDAPVSFSSAAQPAQPAQLIGSTMCSTTTIPSSSFVTSIPTGSLATLTAVGTTNVYEIGSTGAVIFSSHGTAPICTSP